MPKEMSWDDCIGQNIIVRSLPDEQRASEMGKMALLRLEFWNNEIPDKFITLKVEAYYDIIKELVFAHMYKTGFNCSNHLCMIAYLEQHFKDFVYETAKIDELRRVRNDINYRGLLVKKAYLDTNELEFKNIIKRLIGSITSSA